MFMVIVWPSLKPKSSFGFDDSWAISWFNLASFSKYLTQKKINVYDSENIFLKKNKSNLKWSWRATFISNESPRSANPIPINAVFPNEEKFAKNLFQNFQFGRKSYSPESSTKRITKYRLESVTDSTAVPGYLSIGHLANNSPWNIKNES